MALVRGDSCSTRIDVYDIDLCIGVFVFDLLVLKWPGTGFGAACCRYMWYHTVVGRLVLARTERSVLCRRGRLKSVCCTGCGWQLGVPVMTSWTYHGENMSDK